MTRFDPLPRRELLRTASAAGLTGWLLPKDLRAADEAVPQSVRELWADFDPRREPLETEMVREWREDGCVIRLVRFRIADFKGVPARMAALYAFPEGANGKLPAVMHIHGGGQRAFLHEVKFLAGRGYAALSVNWGGSGDGKPPINTPDGAKPGDPNTDWGAVDPTQLNAERYASLRPGPKQLFEDRDHPKNNNWYLLTLGCRRGLTFLEQQPEVDPARLGVHGFSMGGNLTMYVAGTDDRLKAAVPAVGGTGWRGESHAFLGGSAKLDHVQGDGELFSRTLGFESYAPEIRCPVLHRSGTNDFHGWMDNVYRTNALIPNPETRFSFAPHLNHRLIPEVAVSMPLWFDHFLKGGPALPETPASELRLDRPDSTPALRVQPKPHPWPIARVDVFHSVDPDPRARHWRSAEVEQANGAFLARLPLHTLDLPLFAFANVFYTLPEPVSMARIPGESASVRELCLSSLLHTRDPAALRAAGVIVSAKPTTLLDDFSHGLRDWYELNAGNPTHRQTWTRKVTDPLYAAPEGAKLQLTLKMPKANRLFLVLHQNEWRSYRGPRKTFVCAREIPGSDQPQTLAFTPADFTSGEEELAGWAQIDQLGFCAHHDERGKPPSQPVLWQGPPVEYLRLEWV